MPFKFFTRLQLPELTGLRAANLNQLLECIKNVPVSSIYYHTHVFFREYQYLAQDSTSDFAYWVSEALGEVELGEQLSGIDIMRYAKIQELQAAIVKTIETYLEGNKFAKLRFSRKNEEFHFVKSISFILPTTFAANNLEEFAGILKKITLDSVYFHFIEARLRLERPENDFSAWIEGVIGDKELAKRISGLDPYTQTLEGLRQTIIRIIERRISGQHV